MSTDKNILLRHLCVVIPTYNRRTYLQTLLQQLYTQKTVEGFIFHIVVVADGANDGTLEMLSTEFADVLVVKSGGNWWWTKCVNEGIRAGISQFHPEHFLIMNDDSLVEPDYFSCLSQALYKAGDNALIGSISVTDSKPYKVSFSGVKHINWWSLKKTTYYTPFVLQEKTDQSAVMPTYALNGRGTLISTAMLLNLGLLNERSFPQYGSDDDLALRAWKKGYKVLLSYACIVYDRTTDTSKGTAFRQDPLPVFIRSFFTWHSVNYIPKQLRFYYEHGIKLLLPFYLLKFIAGTAYAYFFKYKKVKL